MLHEFVTANRQELIARTRAKVACDRRRAPPSGSWRPAFRCSWISWRRRCSGARPTPGDLQAIGDTAAIHGGHLLEQGFTVSQVVHGYGDVCQALTELAQETDAAITTEEFHTLNRCLDDAIAQAVTEYARLREQAITDEGTMRSGVLAHELRNRLSAASVGFELIKRGTVGGRRQRQRPGQPQPRPDGLAHPSFAGRGPAPSGIEYRERVPVAELIEEAEVDGALEATRAQAGADRHHGRSGRGGGGRSADRGRGDRQPDAERLQVHPPGGHVSLRTSVTENRVLIEVEDQCGGLPPGKAEELFDAFQQRGEDRSGLGLGLFISRKGVEASGGVIRVRDLPGQGCVFTIDLPRC